MCYAPAVKLSNTRNGQFFAPFAVKWTSCLVRSFHGLQGVFLFLFFGTIRRELDMMKTFHVRELDNNNNAQTIISPGNWQVPFNYRTFIMSVRNSSAEFLTKIKNKIDGE